MTGQARNSQLRYPESLVGNARLFARITIGFELMVVGVAASALVEQGYLSSYGRAARLAEQGGALCLKAGEAVLNKIETQ